MSTEIRRVCVYRYNKSGKLAAIFSHPDYGVVVLELSPDMTSITTFRNSKYIKRDAISATKYMIEVREEQQPGDQNKNLLSYQFIRALTPEDLDVKRWVSTASLNDLPVSSEPDLTSEELFWAGKREGNLGGGVVLAGVVVGAGALAVWSYLVHGSYVFPALVSITAGFFLARYNWKPSISADPNKLSELNAHKQSLRQRHRSDHIIAKTQFEKALESFENWRSLSPEHFELALSLRLEKEGYQVKQTRYSKDGGVDIEVVDRFGKPMIVQAKKYASNVGVHVVREMIGVREGRNDKPKTMIYSLSGFTRGAKELAEKHDIELRDIRTELLEV